METVKDGHTYKLERRQMAVMGSNDVRNYYTFSVDGVVLSTWGEALLGGLAELLRLASAPPLDEEPFYPGG